MLPLNVDREKKRGRSVNRSSTRFDRRKLLVKPLCDRKHLLNMSVIRPLKRPENVASGGELKEIGRRLVAARKSKAAIILMLGGHVVRSGVQEFLIDLMKRGYVSCLSMNGAVMIHDYEFALIGATTESVADYIAEGQFGLWEETGRLNTIVNEAYERDSGIGMGEAVGKAIAEGAYPHRNVSLLAAAYNLGIPATVHVGIGYDIIHEHPNFDGAATGATSYTDFLKFAGIVQELEGGMVFNFGSAVMAPEVFLKALSMARNVSHQQGKVIRHFTTVVCDLRELGRDFGREPPKDSAAYYFRPLKTMLIRTVADGGKSFYLKGLHSETIPAVWESVNEAEGLS